MKWVGIIVLLMMSCTAMCEDRDSTKVVERIERKAERKLERKKAKIERERAKIMRKWDERTIQQKKLDRRILIFLTISAGVLVKALSPGVE